MVFNILFMIFAAFFGVCLLIASAAWAILLLKSVIMGETLPITEHPSGENYVTLPDGERRLD